MEAKTGNFVLSHVALRPIDMNIKESLLNQAALFLDYQRRESAAIFDEDWALLEALEPQPKILSCQYRVDQRPTYQFYWYRTAPARFSDPAYLEARLPNHPLLTVGRPQSVCPARLVDLAPHRTAGATCIASWRRSYKPSTPTRRRTMPTARCW